LKENSPYEYVQGEVLSVLLIVEENPYHVVVLVSTRNAIFKYNFMKSGFMKAAYLPLNTMDNRIGFFETYKVILNSHQNILKSVTVGRHNQQMHA